MTSRLSERERKAVVSLAGASAEALHATVMKLREMEARRLHAKASVGSRKSRS